MSHLLNEIERLENVLIDTKKEKHVKISQLIYKQMDGSLDLPYGVLNRAEYNKTFALPTDRGVVMSTRVNDDRAGVISYNTAWKAKAILKNHYHSDCIEIFIPVLGDFHVITEIDGVKVEYETGVGKVAAFAINEKHQITCLSDNGIGKVLFSKHPIGDDIL